MNRIGYLQALSRPLPTYTGPPWRGPEPEKAESACDLIAFYRDYPFATCSFRTARVLAALHEAYRIRLVGEAR